MLVGAGTRLKSCADAKMDLRVMPKNLANLLKTTKMLLMHFADEKWTFKVGTFLQWKNGSWQWT